MSEIIFPNDPKAATYRTNISGWVSRGGIYWGEDERAARYHGSTHSLCNCGAIIEKAHAVCAKCISVKRDAAYGAMPVQRWYDGPACIFDDDCYFFSPKEFFQWCDDNEINPAVIRLVLCKPSRMPLIDSCFFEEVYPEDCGIEVLPKEITDAMDALNGAILNADPISWEPLHVRVDMEDLLERQNA